MQIFNYHNKIGLTLFLSLVCQTMLGQIYLSEDFSSNQMPPAGWSIDNVAEQWTSNPSANAGGAPPEARFQWIQLVDVTKLISPQIDLTGLDTVLFQFNHMYDYYQGAGPSIGIATRSNNGDWTSIWQLTPNVNIGPETVELEISNNDVGQADFQICFYIIGDLFNLDYWYIDDILLYRPEYLDLKLFLEGPFMEDQMTNDLNVLEYIPLSQPFGVQPWNYEGTENVAIIPNTNITDWVLIEFIQKNQYLEQKFNSISKQAGFILQNGTITGLDGISPLEYNFLESDSLFVWLHHRNHLSVMSSSPLSKYNGVYSYDFTLDSLKAYYGMQAMKKISENNWGVLSGDGNSDGNIDNRDKNENWLLQNNNTGYHSSDYNLDGEVNELDITMYWAKNAGKEHWIPDTIKIPFECGDTILDLRDGNSYSTIQIGDQCWMQENLNYETGTSWCYYNSSAYCDTYGRLYTWNTIMNGAAGSNQVPSEVQGICLEGWHLPSDAEWCIVTQHIDSTVDCNHTGYNGTDAGTKMKSTWGWSSGGNGTNESGFNSLPGGSMGIYHFDDLFLFSYHWSCTEDAPGYAWLIKMNYGLPTIGRYFSAKNRGYSVRCLKD